MVVVMTAWLKNIFFLLILKMYYETALPYQAIKWCCACCVVIGCSFHFIWCMWRITVNSVGKKAIKWMGFCLQNYRGLLPRARTTITANVFSVSLRGVFSTSSTLFFSVSWTAPILKQTTQHSSTAVVLLQPLAAILLIVPAFCAETNLNTRSHIVHLPDKPSSHINVTSVWFLTLKFTQIKNMKIIRYK